VRVLAWVPQPTGRSPGQRFRIEQWAPHLQREGIDIVYSPFVENGLADVLAAPGRTARKALGVAAAWAGRLWEAVSRLEADLVYVFREGALVGPAVAERLLALRRPFVFDFDDAVWVRYLSPLNSYFSYLRFPGKTATLCRAARHVMAGNAYLGAYASRYNAQVSIVPTTVETSICRPRPSRRAGIPVIGWTGSFSTAPYLQLLKGALERLRRRHAFRVKVIGANRFSLEGVDVEVVPWRVATEIEDLWDIDVGVMPLPDAEWERGKCGLKALQYMALAVPAVVSPVGVNREIVEHGRTGFHATNEDEWVDALDRLLGDPELRDRVGRAGRALVETRYSAAAVAPSVADVFRSACR
jgi:glycosyltransferase involved in cell wall biosynthesis